MENKMHRLGKPSGGIDSRWMAVFIFLTAVSAANPRGADMKISAQVETPKVIAVRIRHDMCPYCRQLDPKFPEVIRRAQDESVLFVTLDLTSETTQKQAALLVGALGLESVWTGDLSRIGSVVFVDGKSKKILSSVQTVDQKTLLAALGKAVKSVAR